MSNICFVLSIYLTVKRHIATHDGAFLAKALDVPCYSELEDKSVYSSNSTFIPVMEEIVLKQCITMHIKCTTSNQYCIYYFAIWFKGAFHVMWHTRMLPGTNCRVLNHDSGACRSWHIQGSVFNTARVKISKVF